MSVYSDHAVVYLDRTARPMWGLGLNPFQFTWSWSLTVELLHPQIPHEGPDAAKLDIPGRIHVIYGQTAERLVQYDQLLDSINRRCRNDLHAGRRRRRGSWPKLAVQSIRTDRTPKCTAHSNRPEQISIEPEFHRSLPFSSWVNRCYTFFLASVTRQA